MMKNACSGTAIAGTEALDRKVRICSDPSSLGQAAADEFLRRTQRTIAGQGRFTVVLSGGSTPRGLFRALVRRAPADFPWTSVHVFWGDERTVPPNHSDSNYRTAREELLEHVALPLGNIHRMRGEEARPAHAAAAYEEELRRFFDLPGDGLPRFDLIYLGLGPDGHTASLFPGTRALGETKHLVVANPVEKLDTTRLTLTLPVLNNAACIVFLVSGEEKADVLKRVLEGPAEPASLPAQAPTIARRAALAGRPTGSTTADRHASWRDHMTRDARRRANPGTRAPWGQWRVPAAGAMICAPASSTQKR